MVSKLNKELGIEPLKNDYDTQIAGAVGGALFAHAIVKEGKEKAGAS